MPSTTLREPEVDAMATTLLAGPLPLSKEKPERRPLERGLRMSVEEGRPRKEEGVRKLRARNVRKKPDAGLRPNAEDVRRLNAREGRRKSAGEERKRPGDGLRKKEDAGRRKLAEKRSGLSRRPGSVLNERDARRLLVRSDSVKRLSRTKPRVIWSRETRMTGSRPRNLLSSRALTTRTSSEAPNRSTALATRPKAWVSTETLLWQIPWLGPSRGTTREMWPGTTALSRSPTTETMPRRWQLDLLPSLPWSPRLSESFTARKIRAEQRQALTRYSSRLVLSFYSARVLFGGVLGFWG